MRTRSILLAALALAATAGTAFTPQQERAAADRALASVSSAQEHHAATRLGQKVLYHPGYISRIEVVSARGAREDVYRQTKVYHGAKPTEVALNFRDAALAVFDPKAQILRVTVQTTDGEAWTWDEQGLVCPPLCPPGDSAGSVVATTPWQGPPAAQRALASVRNAREHLTSDRTGRNVVYHPGYISRIEVVNGQGVREQVYRQSKVFHGAKPAELALNFRDAALAVFDPQHQILKVTVQTKDGETWTWDERGVLCPPACPPGDTVTSGVEPQPR